MMAQWKEPVLTRRAILAYCKRAKDVLKKLGVEFFVIELDNEGKVHSECVCGRVAMC